MNDKAITIKASVAAPIDKIWEYWNGPEHVKKWNAASDDWHTPRAENDLRPGGKFSVRMEAKDGSFGFDFAGTNKVVDKPNRLEYEIGDGRQVEVSFVQDGDQTHIAETFEPEGQNPVEMQQVGWQMILNNFKKYAESN